MKTVRPKKQASSAKQVETELDHILKDAAIEGAELIREMITNPKTSDASRLAAAKYAIERLAAKDNPNESEKVSLQAFMEIIRDIRSAPKLDSPKVGASQENQSESKDWSGWIKSNIN